MGAPNHEPVADHAGGGVKADTGKPPVGLIPRSALLAEARVLDFGAKKYARHNWRKGMLWSRLGDAALRHLLAWLDGEDIDPETSESHLAHLRACSGFLIEYQERGLGEDDRFKGAA
ncbi:dATP/dGTP diphosphohydrolase domain-containing protein [Roseixanthobacter pseudopolyaromaticivorans]|uniref:dATP/dGTP diphosphohydrolase domain-containing protein n=1 Tax=Xanthobacteraceae TaxID=335928 RepID=UPI0037261FEB